MKQNPCAFAVCSVIQPLHQSGVAAAHSCQCLLSLAALRDHSRVPPDGEGAGGTEEPQPEAEVKKRRPLGDGGARRLPLGVGCRGWLGPPRPVSAALGCFAPRNRESQGAPGVVGCCRHHATAAPAPRVSRAVPLPMSTRVLPRSVFLPAAPRLVPSSLRQPGSRPWRRSASGWAPPPCFLPLKTRGDPRSPSPAPRGGGALQVSPLAFGGQGARGACSRRVLRTFYKNLL